MESIKTETIRETNAAGTEVLRVSAPDGVSHELCHDLDGRYQFLDEDGYRYGERFSSLRDAVAAAFPYWA